MFFLIKKSNSGRNPMITGLLPLVFLVIGIVLDRTGILSHNYVVPQDQWMCSKFVNGECVRLEMKQVERNTKND